MSTKQYSVIIFVIVTSILASFYSGFFLKDLLKKEIKTAVSGNTANAMVPYFNDEIVIVTKEAPHNTLIAYSSRSSRTQGEYSHNQRIFFFDGKKWEKNSAKATTNSSDIAKTPIFPTWNIKDAPTLVLKQEVAGTAQIDNNKIEFSIPVINNELGIRSMPEYTIFRSEAPSTLTINGKEYESYALYTRVYSYASSIDLIEVSNPVGINTDWVAFWDTNGNFYNIDKTSVDQNYKGEYKSHSIAIYKDNEGKVQKSFDTNVQKKQNNGYKIDIFEKINTSLNLDILNTTSKNTGNSPYTWNTGQIKGSVVNKNGKTIQGFGIYEQLYQ